ncbi:MAG: hypothetical protein ACREO8_04665 [Luteimonas sp.]
MSRTPHAATEPSAALNAFLRGVERRAAVFATLQAGSEDAGDRALLSAMRAFRGVAAQLAIADWPRRFWAVLLAAPELREAREVADWPGEFDFLSGLGRGPRAALLLRLVSGLSETDAAGVLGIAKPTYRLALQRALPHRDDGLPDADAWRALGDAAHSATRELSAARLAHLARVREAVLLGRRLAPAVVVPVTLPVSAPDAALRRRWTRPAMAVVATASVVALAATFVMPVGRVPSAADSGRVRVSALPVADAPAATYDADAALLTHADFDQVLGEHADARSRDPGFYAWLAAGSPDAQIARDASASAIDARAVAAPDASAALAPADAPASETDDAPR